MAYLGNTLINGSLRCLNKAYFNDLSVSDTMTVASLSTTGNATIGGTLGVTGATTIAGTLTLTKTTDVSGSANNSPALIIGGTATGKHIEIDLDEIQAKTNGTSVGDLWINNDGGTVYIKNLNSTRSTITTGNITTLKTADVTADNVTVNNVLKSSKWDISNVANLANDFMVAPTIKISSSGTVTIASLNTTAKTCRLTFSDSSQINSNEFGGCRWYAGSKVRITFTVNGTLNSNILGTIVNNMNTTAGTLVVDVTLDNTTNLANGTYEADDSTIMLYEISNSGTLSPVGIRMTAYGTNNSSYIDMYGGTTASSYTQPVFRIGNLNGIAYNGETLSAQWGVYTYNGYFEGAIVANEGKIANFTIASDKLYTGTHSAYNTNADGIFISDAYISFGKQALTYFKNDGTGKIGNWKIDSISLYNGTFGTANSAMVCTGSSIAKVIGGSDSISGWTFTSGANFGVTKTGALYASDVNISGAINATALHVGNSSSTNHLIYENSTIDLQTDWLRFDSTEQSVIIGKTDSNFVKIKERNMAIYNTAFDSGNSDFFMVGDNRYYDSTLNKWISKIKVSINPVVISTGAYLCGSSTLCSNELIIDNEASFYYVLSLMHRPTSFHSVIDAEGNLVTDYTYNQNAKTITVDMGSYSNYVPGLWTIIYYYDDFNGVINFGENNNYTDAFYGLTIGSNCSVEGSSYSIATGQEVTAIGNCASASGYSTIARGNYTNVSGYESVANGDYSVAAGKNCVAVGESSHASGENSEASNYMSFVHGLGLKSTRPNQTVFGKYNALAVTTVTATTTNVVINEDEEEEEIIEETTEEIVDSGNYSFIVGNGTDEHNRENILSLTNTGALYVNGVYTKDKVIDRDKPPASATYRNVITCLDKGGRISGSILQLHYPDSRQGITLEARRTVNDKYYHNSVYLYLNNKGEASVGFSYPAAWTKGLGLDARVVSKKFNGLDTSVVMGTTPSSDYYNNMFNLFDKNNNLFGSVQLSSQASNCSGISIEGRRSIGGTAHYNSLRLLLDSSGNQVVVVSDSNAWRTGLGLSNILDLVRISSFSKTNVSISANNFTSPEVSYTIPSGFDNGVIMGVRVDTTNTTSATNSTLCTVSNYWIDVSAKKLHATVRNHASSAAKVTVSWVVIYQRTTL